MTRRKGKKNELATHKRRKQIKYNKKETKGREREREKREREVGSNNCTSDAYHLLQQKERKEEKERNGR